MLLTIFVSVLLLMSPGQVGQVGQVLDNSSVVADTPRPETLPPSTDEISGLLQILVRATKQRNWAIMAGALLMLFVWGLRSIVPKVSKAWLPLIALLLAGIPGLAMALLKPEGIDTIQALTALVSIWLMASGSWSAIVEPIRQLLRKSPPKF